MKIKYLKIFILLIGLYSLNIFGITTFFKSKIIERTNLRLLIDTYENYDKSGRTDKEDLESIENCENSDYKIFYEYITGHNVTFDRYIDTDRAVSNFK